MSILERKRVLLGVSGGIAAYKACELTRRLKDAGADVRVLMTRAACEFVSPLTFQALSGNPVGLSLLDPAAEAAMGHIELARFAEIFVIAPASADLIARLAHGMADDLLGTVALACAAPLALAPSMNQQMYAHAATQANLATLKARGVAVLGPASGAQACGDVGAGRMLEPAELIEHFERLLTPQRLRGKRVLLNAGPTFEDIDPVRYIGNRSSGQMGFALARAAAQMGAEVTLIAGPVDLATPQGVKRTDVRSAEQMRRAMLDALPGQDLIIAVAAVADYSVEPKPYKIKRGEGRLHLELNPNPDILAELARVPGRGYLVGFAAESQSLESNARGKLERKGVDAIAANWIGRPGLGIDAGANALTLIDKERTLEFPAQPKLALALALISELAQRLDR